MFGEKFDLEIEPDGPSEVDETFIFLGLVFDSTEYEIDHHNIRKSRAQTETVLESSRQAKSHIFLRQLPNSLPIEFTRAISFFHFPKTGRFVSVRAVRISFPWAMEHRTPPSHLALSGKEDIETRSLFLSIPNDVFMNILFLLKERDVNALAVVRSHFWIFENISETCSNPDLSCFGKVPRSI